MLTQFEQYAVTSMMGAGDTPPRANGTLCFASEWERSAFGVALALARDGHFEWEDFRRNLIAAIGDWERAETSHTPDWNYYEQWLAALEATMLQHGLATPEELAARTDAAAA
ncbi:nitrile hydratase accessory protein [Azospirillum canadense]|uniref:nitrile hydratase accessory protein n=1 Tax=Azospirillum canadense TaxID=403962 RepID=UPI00222630C6|nr:nitrile hydratase accessory protein [Azospirillum canadense]MCW2244301.1 nitrile hydratase accessory protein [Azospirillum canadense]